MESFEHNVAYITTPISTYMLIFGRGGGGGGGVNHLVLSEYANQSHNFTDLGCVTSPILFPPSAPFWV